jgi:amidase
MGRHPVARRRREVKSVPKGELFVLTPHSQVAARIRSGETVVVDTEDAFRGFVKGEISKEELRSVCMSLLNLSCPLTGPIYVDGAEPGDVLRIHIDDIECGSYGVSILGPHFCGLSPALFPEFTAKVVRIEGDTLWFDASRAIPVSPMIGTILTCRKDECEYSWKQGSYGGNMDCRYITRGSDLYLPVEVPGALLAMGDCHAVQGDGEIFNPFEIPARITLTPTVLKGRSAAFLGPRVMTDRFLITIASEKPFEVAARDAAKHMILWLTEEFGMTEEEAAYLCGQVAHVRTSQIGNSLYTASYTFPKEFLAGRGGDG